MESELVRKGVWELEGSGSKSHFVLLKSYSTFHLGHFQIDFVTESGEFSIECRNRLTKGVKKEGCGPTYKFYCK